MPGGMSVTRFVVQLVNMQEMMMGKGFVKFTSIQRKDSGLYFVHSCGLTGGISQERLPGYRAFFETIHNTRKRERELPGPMFELILNRPVSAG